MQTDKTEVDRSNEVLAAPARVIATGGCLGFGGKYGRVLQRAGEVSEDPVHVVEPRILSHPMLPP